MRFSCRSTCRFLTVSRPRLTPCRLSFAVGYPDTSVVGFRSVYLTGRSKLRMSSSLQSSFSGIQRRSFASEKINGPVATHNDGNHDHHEHKHGLFGGHAHEHDHATDAEKVIEALKGGGELCLRLSHPG